MKKMSFNINITIKKSYLETIKKFFNSYGIFLLITILSFISFITFLFYLDNGLGLAYNDARSHLDIGRRVVEGLKPGMAQLGSVWLPLPHLLMVPTIWNDFMWHSGLSGAIQSMISYLVTGILIYAFLKKLGVNVLGRIVGVLVFATNINVLYLQSTAMTELLLLATMTAGVYELLQWSKEDKYVYLVRSSFWIMLSTLIRYDGWFLLAYCTGLIVLLAFKQKGYKVTEGIFVLFCTMGGLGIMLWLLWNQLIFKDALYFAFGPFSARAQQQQIEEAGLLATKGNVLTSLHIYFYALAYNTGLFQLLLGLIGAVAIWFDKSIKTSMKFITTALFAPFIFNVLALYMGHSVLFVQGLSGNTWFNVRYGLMMIPSVAIFIGYLVYRFKKVGYVLIALLLVTTIIAFENGDAVTIDDARVGSSQKNVSEVSNWLRDNASKKDGFVLISAASHDAIIFSSGMPMAKFIHEGTGAYWDSATTSPDRWARWIIMRTNDTNDLTFKTISKTKWEDMYVKVGSYPFADIYEIKPEYLENLNTKPVLKQLK